MVDEKREYERVRESVREGVRERCTRSKQKFIKFYAGELKIIGCEIKLGMASLAALVKRLRLI